jgi:two-component system CheB/CheR fusion protein
MDGYELARCIRDELGRDTVLIALTGYGAERDAARAADAGFDQHLTKPVDLNELMKVLDERRAGQRGAEAVRA